MVLEKKIPSVEEVWIFSGITHQKTIEQETKAKKRLIKMMNLLV